jgi:hypothetical protein
MWEKVGYGKVETWETKSMKWRSRNKERTQGSWNPRKMINKMRVGSAAEVPQQAFQILNWSSLLCIFMMDASSKAPHRTQQSPLKALGSFYQQIGITLCDTFTSSGKACGSLMVPKSPLLPCRLLHCFWRQYYFLAALHFCVEEIKQICTTATPLLSFTSCSPCNISASTSTLHCIFIQTS